jgi:hypothetical protein
MVRYRGFSLCLLARYLYQYFFPSGLLPGIDEPVAGGEMPPQGDWNGAAMLPGSIPHSRNKLELHWLFSFSSQTFRFFFHLKGKVLQEIPPFSFIRLSARSNIRNAEWIFMKFSIGDVPWNISTYCHVISVTIDWRLDWSDLLDT